MNPSPDKQPTRKFLRLLMLSVIGISVLLVLVNYATDRYYVFHPQDGVFTEFLEPNTRVLKANYLAENCSRFDAVMFGSSRAAAIRTRDLNRAFGTTTYNFGVATGSLPDILARLEWLAGKGCMSGTVFLPLSIDRLYFTERPNDLLRKEHPDIVGDPDYKREFLLSYLGVDAFFSNLRKLAERFFQESEPRFRYDPRSGDVDYLWARGPELSRCPLQTIRTDDVAMNRYIDFLGRIESLVQARGSKLVLIWNPIPVMDQLAHIEDARRLLGESGPGEKTLFRLPPDDESLFDGRQYHDPGHYRPELASAVFADPKNRVPFRQLLNELEALENQCDG